VAEELYRILGVNKEAAQADIRSAYLSLAKKHHPDLNPGDKASEETFRMVQAAYEILSNEKKRRQYDAGEIDAEGKGTPRQFYREYAAASGDHPYSSSAGFEDLGDIFSDLLRRQHQGGENVHFRMQGGDVHYRMEISFLEAVNGAKKRVTMPDGKTLDIKVPSGHRDGQMLRLRGKGMPGLGGGGGAGDAYVEIHVKPHRTFRRRDQDILVDLPVALNEAVLGAKVRVPTVQGSVTVAIPPGSNTGDTLRLKGKGVPASGKDKAGDQRVTLRIVLPKKVDAKLEAFLEDWAKDHGYDPRQGMGG
jgi:DnaJ-class molecular chaperone